MTESQSFCTACGCNLAPGMQFCPQCGRPVEGSQAAENANAQQQEMQELIKQSSVNSLVFALMIYIIPAVIGALSLLIDNSNIANALHDNKSFCDWMVSHHINLDMLKDYIVYVGAIELASAVCAIVSLICVFKRQKRIIATVFCFIAAALCFWSVLGMFLGFMVTFMIYGAKDCFIDGPKDN